MTRKMKRERTKIIISFILLIIAHTFIFDYNIINNILYVISYIIVGYDIVMKAIRNIFKGKVFDENFLMTIATIGAFVIGEFPEAVAVMLFYQIGELFQSYAVNKSRKSVSELMDIRPDHANLIKGKETIEVYPEIVELGDDILIKPGEKIPLDGVVLSGTSLINTFAITGESTPRQVKKDDEVISGCINMDGTLKIRVKKTFGESTVSKILDLVENASSRKSKSENFISKFARIYTPVVVLIALVLAIIPPLITNDSMFTWIYRACSFLVVSCPCALVISIPLSFFCGIGALSNKGVLVKGSNYLEALANTEIVACDKTGTLTEGIFKVQEINTKNIKKEELLKYACYAEMHSNHPISLSLKEAYNESIDESKVSKTKEISGKGICAYIDKKRVLVGNELLMQEYKIEYEKCKSLGTIVYVAINDEFVGSIVIADKIKDDAYKAIDLFKENNVKRFIMLTGDLKEISRNVAKKLNIKEYHAELLPQDKVAIMEKLSNEKSAKGKLAFIGDGINDAPVLALADIGIAMGGLGSDAAIEAADVVIMTDEPSKLAEAIKVSKKNMKIVRENIIFAIGVKISVLILSALGLATMWASVFADVGVSILAILNALRILYKKA